MKFQQHSSLFVVERQTRSDDPFVLRIAARRHVWGTIVRRAVDVFDQNPPRAYSGERGDDDGGVGGYIANDDID